MRKTRRKPHAVRRREPLFVRYSLLIGVIAISMFVLFSYLIALNGLLWR